MRRFFETLSFLPPLTDGQIAKQVDYIVANNWTPALEFTDAEDAYVASTNTVRFHDNGPCNYYDNRYWTMWRLPMFGCNDAGTTPSLTASFGLYPLHCALSSVPRAPPAPVMLSLAPALGSCCWQPSPALSHHSC